MSHLNLLRTVHCPTTADGRNIKNSFGVVIATATDENTAQAMAELINLGMPSADEQQKAREAREDRLANAIAVDSVRNSPR